MHIKVDVLVIKATEHHPFYVLDKGWVEAKDLEIGDCLKSADGSVKQIESLEIEDLENPIKVYNFEVEDWHTYHVSDSDILVHNDCSQSKYCDEEIKGTSYDINKIYITQPYTRDANISVIKETIKSEGPNSLGPIKILIHKGEALLIDGHNRLEAFRQLGYLRVPIKYMRKNQVWREFGRTINDLLSLKHK